MFSCKNEFITVSKSLSMSQNCHSNCYIGRTSLISIQLSLCSDISEGSIFGPKQLDFTDLCKEYFLVSKNIFSGHRF